jgi:hypothetical protein
MAFVPEVTAVLLHPLITNQAVRQFTRSWASRAAAQGTRF